MRNGLDIRPELARDDTGIPDGMKVFGARTALPNLIATPIVFERDMERLVHVADPMAEKFERHQLLGVRRPGLRQGRDIRFNRGHDTRGVYWARLVAQPRCGTRQVDKVLTGALARVIWPGTGFRKQGEVRVLPDQLLDGFTRLGRELLEGDFTKNDPPTG